MANEKVNKVILGNEILIDLTSDTITPDKLLGGYTAHNASGEQIMGSLVMRDTATIVVYYNSSLYNKTMTCSCGGITYTEITTSLGRTEFEVYSAGFWVIQCDGIYESVNVKFVYDVSMKSKKTVTIYGAKEDFITFTDASGNRTCQFATGETQKSVDIIYNYPSQGIVFTSSVAKNPSDLSSDYRKYITISDNTSEIYLMPDNCLYWYGYSNNLENVNATNGWSAIGSNASWTNPAWNTNNITLTTTTSTMGGVGTTNPVTYVSKWYAIYSNSASASNGRFESGSDKSLSNSSYVQTQNNSITFEQLVDAYKNNRYARLRNLKVANTFTIYALWYKGIYSNANFFGAVNDVVTYKDSNNNDIVFAVTDENGEAYVDYSSFSTGSYTLYSSVAKNPSDLTQNYSKSVYINSAFTTRVNFMPDNALYWYGYRSASLENMNTANGWSGNTYVAPTENTNKITLSAGSNIVCGIGTTSPIAGASSLHAIAQGVTVASNQAGNINGRTSKVTSASASTYTLISNTTLAHWTITGITSTYYYCAQSNNGRKMDLYALWYE